MLDKYPYLKDQFVIAVEKGKIRIINKEKDGMNYQPFNIDPKLYPLVVQFDGQHSIGAIVESLTGKMKEKADQMVEKLLVILQDYVEILDEKIKYREIIDETMAKMLQKQALDKDKKVFTLQNISYAIEPSCGFECVYCFADAKHSYPDVKYLSVAEWDRVVAEAKELGCQSVIYGGGDPARKRNLEEYLRVSHKYGLHARMSTRSHISYERLAVLQENGLKQLQLSFDSHDSKTVDFLAGRSGTYKGLIQTAQNAKKLGIDLQARAVWTCYNAGDYVEWAELMILLGFNRLYSAIVFSSCGKDVSALYPSREQIDLLSEMALNIQKKYMGSGVDIVYNFDYAHLFGKPLAYLTSHRHKCYGSRTSLNVSHDGYVYFCDTMFGVSDAMIGDLKTQSVADVWFSSKMERMKNPNRDDYIDTECATCKSFDHCKDKRCYMRSKRAYGLIFEKDPWCPKGEPLPLYHPL